MINKNKVIIVLIIGFFIISILCSLGRYVIKDDEQSESYKDKDIDIELEESIKITPTIKPTKKPTIKPTKKPTPRKLMVYTLSNGNYKAGKDFKAGIYNITALKGQGNVSSDNLLSGGINAIMGPQDDGFYQKEYKNISLPANTMLKITNVTIKLKEVK